MQRAQMVRLVSVPTAFEARIVAARLGAEGMLWELRGAVGGLYPVGAVDVLVAAEDAEAARGLLLADDVESAFEGVEVDDDDDGGGDDRIAPLGLWLVLVAALALPVLGLVRALTTT